MLRCALFALLVLAPALSLAESPLIDSFDELKFRVPAQKGTAKAVPGHAGQAMELSFEKDSPSVFFISNIKGQPQWDEAAGFSFWLKGDGSSDVGALQFIYDEDYGVRYEFAFPLKNKEWHQVTVAWRDLLPVLPGKNSNPLDAKTSNKPSKLSALWMGKWWHWRDYPAHSFAIDELRLEPKVKTPAVPPAKGLGNLREKLESGMPITIVTMGDSLTDTRHWANREVAWPGLLKQRLEAKYKSKVRIVNPAIGGTQLRQGLIQIPRWLIETPEPDLVTVCYGGNDWEGGMRGPQFLETNSNGVDLIRRATKGQAEVMLLTTVPAVERWTTAAELAAAGRKAAANQKAGLADLEDAFHVAGTKDPERLFVKDKVHLSPSGHELVAETVLKAIEGK